MGLNGSRVHLRVQKHMKKLNVGSKWTFKVGFIVFTLFLLAIIFITEQRSSNEFLNNLTLRIENELADLDKFERNLEFLQFGQVDDNKSLSETEKRVKNVVKVKVQTLFKTMKSEGLENELSNFYMKGERKYSIVLSKWRSGSSFFGDFLQNVPGSYYHYEPLINKMNILDSAKVPDGVERVMNFLRCNYSNVPDYFRFIGGSVQVFKNAIELKNVYDGNADIAATENFVTSVCKVYPFQHTKVIRLKLDNFRKVLTNNKLDVKIILLVRDPRAVMNSRKNLAFCQRTLDCKHPNFLCENMVRDFYTAKVFVEKFPNNVKVVRYEDWMQNLIPRSKQLLKFYGLPYTKSTEKFLLEHTSRNEKHPFSTFRDPNTTISMWMERLSYDEVSFVQSTCSEAMSLWGYRLFNEQEFKGKKLNPTLSFDEFEF